MFNPELVARCDALRHSPLAKAERVSRLVLAFIRRADRVEYVPSAEGAAALKRIADRMARGYSQERRVARELENRLRYGFCDVPF